MKIEILVQRALLGLLCLAALMSPVFGLAEGESADTLQGTRQEQVIQSLQWRLIGPANMGGRVTDIAGLSGDSSTFYVAGADGGLFKTTNGGVTFEELFQDESSYSVGAIRVAPSDPAVIWLGSGEGDPRNSVGYGRGVYRSVDGGRSWTHLGLSDTERIKRIAVDPRDPDVAYVCALGHAWGPNSERGVFKTTDGGEKWERVLFLDQDTGCSDLDIELENPRILYAGMWTFRRKPWRFDDGGGETALYRTMDGGKNWEKLEKGLPQGDLARIGVSVAQSSPNIVYMITESLEEGTLFRSEDRGDSWRMVNKDRNINFRPFYYSDIRADPSNPDHIYSLAGGLSKSTDGGKEFQRIGRGVHGDHQALWIDPLNSNRVLSGSDGGFQISWDGGQTFDVLNNVVLSQFYHIDLDDQQPYNICGGLQDNGTWCGPSRTTHSAGILKQDWFKLTGGDGYYAVPTPGRPHQLYTNLQGGVIFFTDLKKNLTRTIHPYPKITGSAGDAIENHKYRFNWDSPIRISPHDPNVVYFGGNVLFKSRDQGYNWEEISPDLTTNDKDKQRTSGGTIYQDNTAAEFHCTILTIAESPVEAGVIWVGTDDGNVQLTRDGGRNWTNLKDRISGLPEFSWISRIEASLHSAGTAYIAVDNHRSDDFRPLSFKTTDYGQSWTAIHSGLPQNDYVKVVREDPRNPNLIYAGMEHGIVASWDGGGNWHSIRNNLPPVSVRDIRIHPRDHDLVVGTHGRGVWILDDIRALQDLDQALGKSAHLFPSRPAIRWQVRGVTADLGQRTFRASNPAVGATIDFYLESVPEVEEAPDDGTRRRGSSDSGIKVTISDQEGAAIRELRIENPTAGLNRVTWDLRRQGLPQPSGGAPLGRRGRRGGPSVVPGKYQVSLLAEGQELKGQIEVQGDPRHNFSASDYQAQATASGRLFEAQRKTEGLISRIEQTTTQLENLSRTLNAANRRDPGTLPTGFDATAVRRDLEKAVLDLRAFLDDDLRRPPPGMGYRQRPRLREELRSLFSAVDGSTGPPTRPQMLRLDELEQETKHAISRLDQLMKERVQPLNSKLKDLPAVIGE